MVLHLDVKGVCASTASACSSKSQEPSHVLLSLGLHREQCHGSLRLSLSKFNTMEEADYFISVIPIIVQTLRNMSPLAAVKGAKKDAADVHR